MLIDSLKLGSFPSSSTRLRTIIMNIKKLGGGFSNIVGFFIPICGEMIQLDKHVFFKWVGEKPPTWAVQFGEPFYPFGCFGFYK